jgi:hypothetical protein
MALIAALLTMAASNAAPAALDVYAGKYPHDKVAGKTFLTDPRVKAGIDQAVPDRKIRDFIAEQDMVTTPIVRIDDRLLASGWEKASAGDVNWAVLASRDGTKVAVCYSTGVHEWDQGADWYIEGRKVFTLYMKCPSSAEDIVNLGTWPIGPIPG